MTEILKIEHLKKYFTKKRIFSSAGSSVKAVDGVSFSIKKGEVFVLAGESGSGKSTIAKLILKSIQADSGKIIFENQEIKEVMDLCVSCKACKSECPSNVDMATLKAEFLYQYQKTNPASLRSKLIAHNAKVNLIAHRFSWIYNIIAKSKWFKKCIGVHPNRSLPILKPTTLRQWFSNHVQGTHTKSVFLFCDEYTNYYDLDIGIKAVKLLNKLGYTVNIPNHPESARAYISKGFLKEAKAIATENTKNQVV